MAVYLRGRTSPWPFISVAVAVHLRGRYLRGRLSPWPFISLAVYLRLSPWPFISVAGYLRGRLSPSISVAATWTFISVYLRLSPFISVAVAGTWTSATEMNSTATWPLATKSMSTPKAPPHRMSPTIALLPMVSLPAAAAGVGDAATRALPRASVWAGVLAHGLRERRSDSLGWREGLGRREGLWGGDPAEPVRGRLGRHHLVGVSTAGTLRASDFAKSEGHISCLTAMFGGYALHPPPPRVPPQSVSAARARAHGCSRALSG